MLVWYCSNSMYICMRYLDIMNNRLSGCNTARGSSTGLSLVGPTKVKARKSFLFTEDSLKVENNLSE